MTRDGVEHDLKISPYKLSLEGFTFVFSSQFYLNKFQNECLDFIKSLSDKMTSRYKIFTDCTVFALFVLYMKIEKRGFLIIDKYGKHIKHGDLECILYIKY